MTDILIGKDESQLIMNKSALYFLSFLSFLVLSILRFILKGTVMSELIFTSLFFAIAIFYFRQYLKERNKQKKGNG